MICFKCGAVNDDKARVCFECHTTLALTARPSFDITHISDYNNFQDQIINKRFKIIKVIGRGGMGEIFLAEDIKLGRKVAIKSIGADSIRDCDSKTRFLREAQAASRLDHPNICTIYEIASENDRDYIIMQFVDGVNLDHLQKLKPLSLGKIIDIAQQVTDGMMEAHVQNIVHRDLKPGNIMIDKSGKVKILDFGLAKICTSKTVKGEKSPTKTDLTEKGIVMGTVAYMSPEQAKGLELDGRSDIFSFGVMLFELLEQRNPFVDKENIVTLYNILNKEITLSPELPVALQKIVHKTLQKERKQRYSDFSEIKNDLTAVRASLLQSDIERAKTFTEIIPAADPNQFFQEANRRRHASDDENVSAMVRRLKRQKASTVRMEVLQSKKFWLGSTALVMLLLTLALLRFVVFKPAAGPKAEKNTAFNILLYPVENQSSDREIAPEISYLLQESLNQFSAFKVLDEHTVPDLFKAQTTAGNSFSSLLKKFNIQYFLKVKLSNVADKFNIEADFSKVNGGGASAPFFIPGKDQNSLLTDQVDNLTRRILQVVPAGRLGTDRPLCALAGMYGNDWQAFTRFFQGLTLWNRKQFGPARQKLLNAAGTSMAMPVAGYYLARLADFMGSGAEAVRDLDAVIPGLEHFSRPWQLKIMALQAKFDFDYKAQIDCLQELKIYFPLNKETFYELGEAYFHCGNARLAVPEYHAALALDADYPDALNHLGYCYSYQGLHFRAIAYFERYRELDRTANSFDSLGDGYFFMGDYIQAENNKTYAASLDNTMDWPYLALADIHILKANFNEAEKNLRIYENMATNPKARADAIAKRAYIRYHNSDYAGALRLLDQALRTHDSDVIAETSAETHWLKGLCAIAVNDLPRARREWLWLQASRDKYRLTPTNFHAILKYCMHMEALILEKENKSDQAQHVFQDLLAMKTQLSFWITQFHYQFFQSEYGEFLLRQKKLNSAALVIRESLGFNPDYPPALWTRFFLFKQKKDPAYRDVLQRIAVIYGPSKEKNIWRQRLAAALK